MQSGTGPLPIQETMSYGLRNNPIRMATQEQLETTRRAKAALKTFKEHSSIIVETKPAQHKLASGCPKWLLNLLRRA